MAKGTPARAGLCRLFASFALIAALLAPVNASAQDDPKSLARSKLIQGGERLKAGDYTEALKLFEEAYALVPSPKIFYNFGLAYSNLGRASEAVDAFEKFLDEAGDASPDTRANAERHRSELLPQVASVTIHCDLDGAEISIDGRPKGTTPRKTPVRVDPGPHSLVVQKAPLPAFTHNIDAKAGERLTVDVTLNIAPAPEHVAPVKAEPVISPPAQQPSLPEPEASHLSFKTKISIVLGAAAVVGLAFGTYEQLAASSKYDQFNSLMAPNPYLKCDGDSRVIAHGGQGCASLLNDGDSASLRAKIGFAVGGALAASSVVVFVLSRREHHETATSFLGCSPTTSGALCAIGF